jgi:cell division protein FtsB
MTKSSPSKSPSNKKKLLGVKTLVQLAVLAGIVVVFLFSALNAVERIADANEQRAGVEMQIETELYKEQEIMDTAVYMRSVPFVESVARNFLGLVYRDEIILIMKEGAD